MDFCFLWGYLGYFYVDGVKIIDFDCLEDSVMVFGSCLFDYGLFGLIILVFECVGFIG